MGTFTVEIEASDTARSASSKIDAAVETGATYTTLPTSLLRRVGVTPQEQRRFALATGVRVMRDVGWAWLRVDGHEGFSLVVFGDENATPLLGAVTLEEMGLGVDPVAHKLVPVDGFLMGYAPDDVSE